MRLDAWLSLTGTTQAELARKLEITPASANRLSLGKQNTTLDMAEKIAKLTNGAVTAEDLRAAFVEQRAA